MIRKWAMALVALISLAGCTQNETYDVLVLNGRVYDGTGSDYTVTDIGIKNHRITKIGNLKGATAHKRIDAQGLSVSPGFIDLHGHLESINDFPQCENFIRQGITTSLGGPDGWGFWPFDENLNSLAKKDISINVGYLVGHNVVRENVMGLSDREPTTEELEKMKSQVATAMRAGAFGMSTGLKYLPGTFSDTKELIELAKVASRYGGIYTSHLRDEGSELLTSVREALTIGVQADIPIVLTHHKVVGKPNWGASVQSLALVDSAREAGVDVMLDQYPYSASHTTIQILIPPWALEGGKERFMERVANKVLRDSIRNQIIDNLIHDRGGNDLRRVQLGSVPWDHSLDGKNLYEWCLLEGLSPTFHNGAELVIRAESNGGAHAIFHAMDEDDIKRIMRHPYTAIATDGTLSTPGRSPVHPRSYGTFPRVFAEYVRKERVIPIEEAIRKMTSLPASRMGLKNRGSIREQYFADIVIFDSDSIRDTNTYVQPHAYPAGIHYVIVNGQIAVEDDSLVNAGAGRVLYGSGRED